MINDFHTQLSNPGVYFRKGHRYIKIGHGKNMLNRLEGARTDTEDGIITVVGYIISSNYKSDEIEAHNYFSEFRQHGEWFDISPEQVQSYIEYKEGMFFREAKILAERTRTTVQTLWGLENVSSLRPRCAWYPHHQAAIKDKAHGNSNKREVYHTIPVERTSVFNEKHPSFSHKGEYGQLRFYASGKKYKEWNDEKRFIRAS